MEKEIKMVVLNSPILTNWGNYSFTPLDVAEAKEILNSGNFVSAVGHEATAIFLSGLLGVEIPHSRRQILMGVVNTPCCKDTDNVSLLKNIFTCEKCNTDWPMDQVEYFTEAVVLKLKTRLPEGKVLTEKEMAEIEYDLGLLEWKGL